MYLILVIIFHLGWINKSGIKYANKFSEGFNNVSAALFLEYHLK